VEGIRILDGRVSPGAETGWVEALIRYGELTAKERLEFVREPTGWRVARVAEE